MSRKAAVSLWQSACPSVAYLSGQEFEILVAGNHLEDLLHGDFAEGEERGRSNHSSLFVPDRSDRWHEI